MEKVLLSWSGGKDSAIALREIQRTQKYKITALLTTITKDYDRISMHGVRRVILEKQAVSLGLPLHKVFIPKNGSNEEYNSKMKEEMTKFKKSGLSSVVFGDIFLEDVRRYREDNLSAVAMNALFPLWNMHTAGVAKNFIDSGFKAIVTCIDSKVLDAKFTGKMFDERFLSDLPSGVDPCGENGEFHTFVFDGPIFRKAVKFKKGGTVLRDERFYYCDVLPDE